MALFGKKEPCAICGGKVKGLFPWIVEGKYICNDCYGNTDLPMNAFNKMTLDEFRRYREFRTENEKLKESFRTTEVIDLGVFADKIAVDVPHRWICFDKHLGKTIFEGRQIRYFSIREDGAPLFEGSADGLVRHTSSVPQTVSGMMPLINRVRMQRQMEKANSNRNGAVSDKIDIPDPFEKFIIEIEFDHPYWDVWRVEKDGPKFNDNNPDISDYLRNYNADVDELAKLARALMKIAFSDDRAAEEEVVEIFNANKAAAAAAPVDAVAEIKKYKELLDMGIITKEEFDAKKRQLMGI